MSPAGAAGAGAPAAAPRRGRRDALWVLATLALVLAWDASGLDLWVVRQLADAGGFRARHSTWAGPVLHDGGRWAAWLVLGALAWPLVRRHPGAEPTGQPPRAERRAWLLAMLACAVLVPLLKRASLTSCPWDLAEFGGVARYVPHWLPGVADGGPGHCFPSGHAVSAFAFLGAWFLWREHDGAVARRWLAGTLVAGVLFGGAQLVRGAHYPSHTLWTAWICLAWMAAFAAWRRRLKQSHP